MICSSAKYNESIGEWTVKGIAFAGNNVHEVSWRFDVRRNISATLSSNIPCFPSHDVLV